MRKFHGVCLWVISIILCPLSLASTNPGLVKVNVIVFTHANKTNLTSENWPQQFIKPSLPSAVNLAPSSSNQLTYRVLPGGEIGLEGTVNRLRSNGNTIILNTSWLQPRNGSWVRLPSSDKFSGVLQISDNRFFLASAQLFLTLPETGTAIYNINAKQGFKINQVVYFDHPLFGALVYVQSSIND